jgi:hypothetical protein
VPAEAREGQLEQKRCYRPDKPDGVLRTLRFVSVAANCGPAGIKPTETSPLNRKSENKDMHCVSYACFFLQS